MTVIEPLTGWLPVTTAAYPDTLTAAQAVADLRWLSTLTAVAIVLLVLLLLAVLIVLLLVLRSVRSVADRTHTVLDRVAGELGPITGHVRHVADNVDYITTSVRADVHQLSRTVQQANDRLQALLLASERRLRELGGLLRVIQEEVEDAVVSAASTLRGVRAGAAAFREDAEALLEGDGPVDDLSEGDDDGYDSTGYDDGRRPRPRVRPRARSRGSA
jgi:uncharacterized protein YoxC